MKLSLEEVGKLDGCYGELLNIYRQNIFQSQEPQPAAAFIPIGPSLIRSSIINIDFHHEIETRPSWDITLHKGRGDRGDGDKDLQTCLVFVRFRSPSVIPFSSQYSISQGFIVIKKDNFGLVNVALRSSPLL